MFYALSEGQCMVPGREATHACLLLACWPSRWHEGDAETQSSHQMLLSISESWAGCPRSSSPGRAPWSPAGCFGIKVGDRQMQFPVCPRSRPQTLFFLSAGPADPQKLPAHTKRRGNSLHRQLRQLPRCTRGHSFMMNGSS